MSQKVRWGAYMQKESMTAGNRQEVLSVLAAVYNEHLSRFSKASLRHMCHFVSRLVSSGFGGSSEKRIAVSSSLLLELLHAVYFLIPTSKPLDTLLPFADSTGYHFNRFNDIGSAGEQALLDIHSRAEYELYADVMLVTNAIRNSLRENPSGQPSDGPMGISVALSPAQNQTETLITNASFKTRKLPDDIPIQPEVTEVALASIAEEDVPLKSKLSGIPLLKKSVLKGKNDVKSMGTVAEDDGFVSGSEAGTTQSSI